MNLKTAQSLSVATKIITRALGVAQTLIVVRLLSQAEYGLVGLVLSIGSLIGVAQHLGVDDGTVHKVATAKTKKTAGEIFWVGNIVRQAITLPLSLGLLMLAGFIANHFYARPEIVFYLQLFAAILILQGVQGVMGATLTGLKRFKELYFVQVTTAVINVVVFAYLVWRFGITGFFAAMIVTTSIMVALFIGPILKQLKGSLALPSAEQVKQHAKDLFRVSAWLYLARIFFTAWQRLPLLVFGGIFAAETLGEISVGIQAGMTLIIFSAAISEVNLSWMSSLYEKNREKFLQIARWDIGKISIFLGLMTLIGLVFTTPLTSLAFGSLYLPAVPLIRVMIAAFFFYAITDVVTNSVLVAARRPHLRAIAFGTMSLVSLAVIAWLFYFQPDPLLASFGMLVGAGLGTIVAAFFASKVLASSSAEIAQNSTKIICFAGAFYNAATWTNRQQIMSRVAVKHPVFFVEPRTLLWKNLNLSFLSRILWPARHDNLFALAQFNFIPGSRQSRVIAGLNHYLFNYWRVLLIAKALGFNAREVIIWIYDTEAAQYLPSFKKNHVLYDCVDDHAAQAGANAELVKTEEEIILKRANVVTVTSSALLKEKGTLDSNVHLVAQAADVEAFAQIKTETDGKTVGTIGALDKYKVDVDLIKEVAGKNPVLDFLFVGGSIAPNQSIVDELKQQSNTTVTGIVNKEDAPAKVASFDVCIIPYRDSAYNASSFPLKFWEFMATGKPIVVSGLPELKKYASDGLIHYANSHEEFSEAIKKALADPDQGRQERINLAMEHSWIHRVQKLLNLIEGL